MVENHAEFFFEICINNHLLYNLISGKGRYGVRVLEREEG